MYRTELIFSAFKFSKYCTTFLLNDSLYRLDVQLLVQEQTSVSLNIHTAQFLTI